MKDSVSRMLKSMLLMLVSAIFLISGTGAPLSGAAMMTYAASAKTKTIQKKVSSGRQLKKALAGKKNRKIILTKGGTYSVGKGTYKNVTIIVKKKSTLKIYGKGIRVILEKQAGGSKVWLYGKNTVESKANISVQLKKKKAKNSLILAAGKKNKVKVLNSTGKKKVSIRIKKGNKTVKVIVKKGKKNPSYVYAAEGQNAGNSAARAAEVPSSGKPVPETPAPGTPSTETPAPGTPSTETPAPGTQSTETPAPGTQSTETPAPGTQSAEKPVPDTPSTEKTVPETSATEKPAPETPATETPAAEKPVPETPDTEAPKPDTPVIEEKALVAADKTRLVDLGFARYVAVTFAQGRNLDNTQILVDGADVSGVMTNVSDDGSVVKWEVSTLKPAQLTAVDRSDSRKKTVVKLSDQTDPQTPQVRKSGAPAYVLGYAPVAYWDYYLTNYDDSGKARVHAAKTTFASAGQKQARDEHPYYSPDAEIDASGNGAVTIMFNYNTDSEKAWFDSIPVTGALELVTADQYRNVLNNHLEYTKQASVVHGSSFVGTFTIPAGQDNFRTNGRYFVRIRPASGNPVLAGIQLVNAETPVLSLKEHTAIQPGQNVHFTVENLVYGIQDPTERVTLTGPDGKTEELTFIDDYFLMSQDLFVLYNDVTRNDGKGVSHTQTPGDYTLTLYAAGFKPASCIFTVSEDASAATAAYAMVETESRDLTTSADDILIEVTAGVDSVSHATGVPSGGDSSSGGGGAGAVSANLVYNVDLLVNAEIFDKLGLGNAYATAIVDRYESQMTAITAVYDETGTKYFDFSDYYNAVQKAARQGIYLTFAEYSKNGKAANKNSAVKEVLEDNLLGDLQENGGYTGLAAPKLILTDAEGNAIQSVAEGSDAYLTAEDPETSAYIEKITGLYNEENWYAPIDNSDGSWGIADGKLRIGHELLKVQKEGQDRPNVFTIKAEGYKDAEVMIPCEKVLEQIDLKLETAEADPAAGNDITAVLEGSRGDFAVHLTAVLLQDGDGEARRLLTKSEGGESGNDWYELAEDDQGIKNRLILKAGLFQHEADYTLTLKAEYYKDLTLTFHVAPKPAAAEGKKTPVFASASKDEWTSAWTISFTMKEEDADLQEGEEFNEKAQIAAWLEGLDDYDVVVGGKEYTEGLLSVNGSSFKAASDPTYGGPYCLLQIGSDGVAAEGPTEITIRSEGYRRYTFTINNRTDSYNSGDKGSGGGNDNGSKDDDPSGSLKKAPATLPALDSTQASSQGYFQMTGDAEFTEWLRHVTGFRINDTDLQTDETGNIYYASGYGIRDSYRAGETALVFTKNDAVKNGDNTITITADGYEDMKLVLTRTDSEYYWADPAYSLRFAEGSESAAEETAGVSSLAAYDENLAEELFGTEETADQAMPEDQAGAAVEILSENQEEASGDEDVSSVIEEGMGDSLTASEVNEAEPELSDDFVIE